MLFFQFTVTKARKMRSEIFQILKSVVQGQVHPAYATCLVRSNQFLEWAFFCGEFREYIDAFCRQLCLAEQLQLLDARQINFQRLLFCLDRENLSSMKLVLAQFKKGTKEPEYLATIQQ